MSNRLDPLIEANRKSVDARNGRIVEWIPSGARVAILRQIKLMLVGAFGILASNNARAAEPLPEGIDGWWYYIASNKSGYTTTPQKACALSAANHFGVRLLSMLPAPIPKAIYRCFYKNPVGGSVQDYSSTSLHCKSGYSPKSPGICVKWPEAPRPPSCAADQAGFAIGNPVAVASGAKIQTETDLFGSPNGALRVSRTYRSVREGGTGQSAGQAWSFSFDRNFFAVYAPDGGPGAPPVMVTGTFGDGSYFEFNRQNSGKYDSKYDKRESVESLNAAFDEWLLTTRDGNIERFKKVGGQFVMISSHTKEGVGQFYTYGPDNKLATISAANGRTLAVTWAGDAVGAIIGATGSVRYSYEMIRSDEGFDLGGTERLAAVEIYDEGERLLATRRYHYEDANYRHLLTGITDENGVRFATYAYNAAGQAVLSEHAGGADRYTFSYPEKAKRIVTDPLGTQREIALAYGTDALGRATSTNQPGGAGCGPGSSSLTYDRAGRPSSSTDFNDRKTCFVTEPARGLVTSAVSGLAPTDACPASGTAAIAASSRRVSIQWHPDLALETGVASAKQITRYVYNGQPSVSGSVANCADSGTLPNGKPIVVLCSKTIQATTDANGAAGFAALPVGHARSWHYSYNAAGQLLKQTGPADALGQVASIDHDYYDDTTASHAKGDLASTKNAAGDVTKYLEYTKDGLASRIQRADGVAVSLAHGAMQRIIASTVEGSKGGAETTQYSYDGVGQLVHIVLPDGAAKTLDYDDAHRLTGVSDGVGSRIALTLDNMGNVTRQEYWNAAGALVQVSSHAFDALNRLAKVQRGQQSTAVTYQYDRGGNLTAQRDALGRVIAAEFDNFDRMTKTTLPAAAEGKPVTTIRYGFDQQDNLVNTSDPRRLTTRYALDGYGQQGTLSSPDTGTETGSYDDAGNLLSSRDARGVTTKYGYDAAQRAIKVGDVTVEYGKDGTSAAGRLTTMTDESGKSSFSYDGYGRLQAKTQTVGSGTVAKRFTLTYEYGASGSGTGHVTSMTYPSGNRVGIAYANGRAISLTLISPNAAAPRIILSDIGYGPFASVQSWTWGNGTSTRPNLYRREFDAAGRITSYPLGAFGANGTLRRLSYDDAGRIKATVHTGAPNASGLDQRYAFDDLDRLIGVEGANVSQSFEYDANGNRTKSRFGAGIYANTIDSASNRLTKTTGPAPARANTYDSAGNLTNDGNAKFNYGTDGRISSVAVAGITTRYHYNGFGQRVVKSGAAGNLTYYVYDPVGRLVGEYDQAGKAIQETVYLDDLPVAVLKPGVEAAMNQTAIADIYFVYADHISTPRVITRFSDNRMVWRWDNADPFGLQQPDDSPGGLPKFIYNPRFPGQVFDKETNNYYNYFRDYDPQTGRYIQSDPMGLAGGINTYGYVGGNPLGFADPYGLTQCDIDAAFETAFLMNLDLNFGEGRPIVDLPWNGKNAGEAGLRKQGLSYVPDRSGRIHLSMAYLGTLNTAQKIDLLDTIIHEGLHFSGPSLLQGKEYGNDHIFINLEAARRTAMIQKQYLKNLKKCGCR